MGSLGANAPDRLGRYELLARLATGGMGEIFLARLEGAAGFEKLFVIKRILPHLADDARFRAMLIAEARIASKMAHANICHVYELGETDGQLYIAMEYLEGVALLALLRRASRAGEILELGLVGAVVQQVTDALHYAHELRDRDGEMLGIVHRDVTPGNIFVGVAGMAKVLDFGIAKVKDASANTQTGTVKGKYAYMAPEQLRGASVDRRADVFALGVVIFEMLALRRLFQRKTDYLTFRAVIEQPIPDLRRYRPDVPDALAEAIARALDREPDGRYTTARLLGGAVLDALGTRPWTQGELGDYVRTTFADEIGRRRAQTASAIEHTAAGHLGRSAMPVITSGEPAPLSDDDDDGLPMVDTAVTSEKPLETRSLRAPSPVLPAHEPQPFGTDSRPSAEQIQPLGRHSQQLQPLPAPMVVVAKRSVIWPIFAIAMVGIAGAALFLVWRQMENQPPTKQEIIITSQPAIDAAVEPPPAPPPPPPVAVGSGAPVTARPPARTPRPAPADPYRDAFAAQHEQMKRCAQEHGLTGSAKVVIVVSPSGRAKSVSLLPAGPNSTQVATCIKDALSSTSFPTSKEDVKATIPISVKSS